MDKMFYSIVAGLQHFYRFKNTLAYYVQIVLKHCANDGVINSVIHTTDKNVLQFCY